MHIMVCLDDDGGMLFHNRRQSKDKTVRADIYERTAGATLWMNAYSQGQFAEDEVDGSGYACIKVDEDFLALAGAEDFCFIENLDILPYAHMVDTVYLYKWNRKYPHDMDWTMDMSEFVLDTEQEFVGNSHEKITLQIWKKQKTAVEEI